jgi:prepilin-type processing-associated H-X9-DG protein
MSYIQDYDELCLVGSNYNWATESGSHINWFPGVGWARIIYPYVKSDAAFVCPSDPTQGRPAVSYAYNGNLPMVDNGNPAKFIPYSTAKMTAPTMTVMFFECFNNYYGQIPSKELCSQAANDHCSPAGNGRGVYNQSQSNGNPICETGYMGHLGSNIGASTSGAAGTCYDQVASGGAKKVNGPVGLHGGGSNFIMCDGHVKWLSGMMVSPGNTAATSKDPEFGPSGGTACGTEGTFTGNGDKPAATFSPI